MTVIIARFKNYLQGCLSENKDVYDNSEDPLIITTHKYFCKQTDLNSKLVINTWLAMRELILKNFKSLPMFRDIVKTLQVYHSEFYKYCIDCECNDAGSSCNWSCNDRMWVYHFFKEDPARENYVYEIIKIARELNEIYANEIEPLLDPTYPANISGNLLNDFIIDLEDIPAKKVVDKIITFFQHTIMDCKYPQQKERLCYYDMFDFIVDKLVNKKYTNHTESCDIVDSKDILYIVHCAYAAVKIILEKKFDIDSEHNGYCDTYLNNHKALKEHCYKCNTEPFICIHCFAYELAQDCIKYGGYPLDFTIGIPDDIHQYRGYFPYSCECRPSAEDYRDIELRLSLLEEDIHHDSSEYYKKFTTAHFETLKNAIDEIYKSIK